MLIDTQYFFFGLLSYDRPFCIFVSVLITKANYLVRFFEKNTLYSVIFIFMGMLFVYTPFHYFAIIKTSINEQMNSFR